MRIGIVTKALVILCGAAVYAGAQQRGATSGPTMAETKAWIETEMPPLLGGYRVHTSDVAGIHAKQQTWSSYSRVALADCVLTWSSVDTLITYTEGLRTDTVAMPSKTRVPLRQIDLATVKAGWYKLIIDSPVPQVEFYSSASTGKVVEYTDPRDGTWKKDTGASLYVRDEEDAKRVAKAVSRAAELCGAKRSPF